MTTLLSKTSDIEPVTILDEPLIECGFGQCVSRPQDGLSLFGPCDRASDGKPGRLPYGLVGTPEGIGLFQKWSTVMRGPVASPIDKSADLWPMFPGFDVAFASEWPETAAWSETLDRETLLTASRDLDPSKRAYEVTNLV